MPSVPRGRRKGPPMLKALLLDERYDPSADFGVWCEEYDADSILIANDHTANDERRMVSMKLAAPPGITMAFREVALAVGLIRYEGRDKKLLVVVQNQHDHDTIHAGLPPGLLLEIGIT